LKTGVLKINFENDAHVGLHGLHERTTGIIKSMAKVNFTTGRIADFKCDADKDQTFLWDTAAPGLGLRATSKGAKAYMFQAKLNGQAIRVTIGSPSIWTIPAAQAEARRLKVIIDSGQDPRQVKAEKLDAEQTVRDVKEAVKVAAQNQAIRETITLGMVWPIYIAAKRSAKRKGGKIGWSEWHIRDHENVVSVGGEKKVRGKGLTEAGVLASLLDVRLADLTGARIAAWLAQETVTRPTRAALAFRLLSVFINWCASHDEYKGLVPDGACKADKVTNELPAKNSKSGDSLQREQLHLWFKSVREIANPVQSAYLQSLLLTGARRRELGALKWADIDFQWNKLTIRDKVEGERTIPLTPFVSNLLAALPRRNEWVFSSPAAQNGQLVEPSPAHKKALIAAGLPDLTLHGLRRSFGSLAEWTETPAGVVAQIMGHKPSAIAEKHYRDRPIDLLRMWHIKIEAWILEQAQIEFTPAQTGLRVVNK
jgi:integrase